MDMMLEYLDITIIGLSVFCTLMLGLSVILFVKLRRTRKDVRFLLDAKPEVPRLPAAAHEKPAEEEPAKTPFESAIFEAEAKKRLKEGLGERDVPEKYRYAPCLLKRGLKNEEIAEVLNLSSEEVDQIAKLTRIVLHVEKVMVH